MGRRRPASVATGLWLLALVAGQQAAHADDLGPLLSECVGAECPLLAAYPNPNMFPAPPAAWLGHDEAFNAVVQGDFTVPAGGAAETEGRMAIGGDFLPARGYSVGISGGGTYVVGPRVGFNNLIVRGAATGTNTPFVGTVATLGTTVTGLVVVGGTASGITFDMGVLTQNVGTSPMALGIDFDALFAALTTKSQCWSLLAATGTLIDEVMLGNGWVLEGDDTSSLQVFNLAAGALDIPGQVLSFRQIPTGATVLVNIAGSTPVINIPLMDVTTTTSPTVFNLLFNAFEATTLSIAGDLNSALLAPLADVTLNANVNGRFAAGGDVVFSGAGFELHNYPFTGDLPACAAPTETPTATPTDTPTLTPSTTATLTATPTVTTMPTASSTPSPSGTLTPSATPTLTQTPSSTATPTVTATATASGTPTRHPPVIEPTPAPGDGEVDCDAQPNLDPDAACILICVRQPGINPVAAPCAGPDDPLGQGGTNAAGMCIAPGGSVGIPLSRPLEAGECIYAYDACNDIVGPVVCIGIEAAPALSDAQRLAAVGALLGIGALALARRRAPKRDGNAPW